MNTDITERGLERLIYTALTGHPCDPLAVGEMSEPLPVYGGGGLITAYS